MSRHGISRLAGVTLIVLSLVALLTVLSGYLQPAQPPEADEGAAAHIFQLSVAASALTLPVFCVTAEWSKPLQSARPLLVSGAALALAFGALYYLERYRWIAR